MCQLMAGDKFFPEEENMGYYKDREIEQMVDQLPQYTEEDLKQARKLAWMKGYEDGYLRGYERGSETLIKGVS